MLSKVFKALTLFLFLAIAPTIYSYVNDENYEQKEKLDSTKPGYAIEEHKMLSGYNAPSRIDIQGSWDFFASGEFIYWKPIERGLDLGMYLYLNIPVSKASKMLGFDFEYKPGFKVDLGWNMTHHDDWALYAEYTWIKGEMNTHHDVPSDRDQCRSVWNGESYSAFTAASSSWNIKTQILDANLQRAYYVGTMLTFRPFMGLRGYWIDQKYNIGYKLAAYDTPWTSHSKSKSWAVGVRSGFVIDWILYDAFRFIGKGAGSLAYQHFKVNYRRWSPSTGLLTNHLEHKLGKITPNIEGSAGIAWGTYLNDKYFHIDFTILYDFLFFVDQNKMLNVADELKKVPENNLFYHGLSIRVKLDF